MTSKSPLEITRDLCESQSGIHQPKFIPVDFPQRNNITVPAVLAALIIGFEAGVLIALIAIHHGMLK